VVVRIWAGLREPKKARKVACLTVDYFFYCRGRPGTEAPLAELAEAHWSFMDRYAQAMIARGPTLTPDRTTWTGSMHMVDLPDAQAARVFAFHEPFYRAGVYGEVLMRRWRNVLGRTMWDYPAEPGDDRRFLVIGRGKPGVEAARQALEAAQRRWFGEPATARGSSCAVPCWLTTAPGGWAARCWFSCATAPLRRPCWPARRMCRPGCMPAWRFTTGSSAGATKADVASPAAGDGRPATA
jgi:hypothetical protein